MTEQRPMESAMKPARQREAGFTLIEVLVVLAIIGLIMGLAGPKVLSYLASSKSQAAELQIRSFSTGLELFYLDMGRYPNANEGLRVLVEKPAALDQWNGPYLKGELPNDPWGRPYIYRSPGQREPYEILSAGPNGQEGIVDNVATSPQ